MGRVLIEDEVWSMIEGLLPVAKRSAKGGRPAIGNREVLSGIVFVLRSGIPWEMLPQELRVWQRHDVLASTSGLVEGPGLGARA